MMGWGWGTGWGGAGGWWGVLMTLAMWAIPLGLIFLFVWALAPRFGGGANAGVLRQGGGGGRAALDIIEERYARGEISRDEFQRLKEDLRR